MHFLMGNKNGYFKAISVYYFSFSMIVIYFFNGIGILGKHDLNSFRDHFYGHFRCSLCEERDNET